MAVREFICPMPGREPAAYQQLHQWDSAETCAGMLRRKEVVTPFVFLIACLATYRLTVLVARDRGPFDCFAKLRKLAPKWLGCPFCFSITAAALIDMALYLNGYRDNPAMVFCTVLALSAVAIILDRCFTVDHAP